MPSGVMTNVVRSVRKPSLSPPSGGVHPHTIGTDDLFAGVTDEGEWQGVKFDEFPVALRGIDADPEQSGVIAKLCPRIAKLICLSGASRRLVLRIEVEDDLFTKIIAKMERLPISELASKRRCAGTRMSRLG
jgi:hypothetical protein